MGTLHGSLCAALVLGSSSMQETDGVQGPSCSSFVSATVLLIKLQLAVLGLLLQSGQHKVVALAGLADLLCLCRRLMAWEWDGRVRQPISERLCCLPLRMVSRLRLQRPCKCCQLAPGFRVRCSRLQLSKTTALWSRNWRT
jgi:hypothetical protein